MDFLDIFSGAGLASYGALEAGFDLVGAIEHDNDFVDIYNSNFGTTTKSLDVKTVDFSCWRGIDHIHASPPCQVFSGASSPEAKRYRDSEKDLVLEVVRSLREISPTSFSIEQVPEFYFSDSLRSFISFILESDYNVYYNIFNFYQYGVPQYRRRFLLIGSKQKFPFTQLSLFDNPTNYFEIKKSKSIPSWFDYIEDLIPFLDYTSFADWQLKRINQMPSSPCLVPRVGTANGKTLRLYSYLEPSPTIRALGHHRQYRQFDVWDGSSLRKVTPRCFARLQLLSDDFVLPSSPSLATKAIGNGVPPLIIKKLLHSLYERAT